MELKSYHFIFFTLLLLALVRLYQYSHLSKRPTKFPPGPMTLPFIGNLHQMPLSRPEIKMAEWASYYGSFTGIKLGQQSMIILNTWQVVRDLIEQRGSIYSSRPYLPVVELVAPGGVNIVLNQYGDLWRKQRKVLVEFLGGDRSDRMKPVQDAESTQMIYDMMNAPDKFQDHVFRSFGAVIMATVFGQRGKTFEEGGKIQRFFACEEEWAEAVSPTSCPPIASFPFLESIPDWMTPWKGWRNRAARVMDAQDYLYNGLLRETRERLKQGKGLDCFCAQLLKSQEKEWYDDRYLAYLGGVLLEGGAETSASATLVFILAMAAFPDVLNAAQEEVDRVCGTERLPGKDDTERLPYIKACMMEVLRWRPIAPTAIVHHTSAADTYQSYNIAADTNVLINVWGLHHDPSQYADPSTFNPSRFLQNRFGVASTSSLDALEEANKGRRPTYAFGAGRRVCPGQRFAENTMIMHFAKLAWAFDIKPGKGQLPVDTRMGWTEGVLMKPKNFNIEFTLRDEGRKKIIEKAWKEADGFLRQFES